MFAAVAVFLGYDDPAAFRAELRRWLRCVEDRYAHLFEESPTLSAPGSLVFTGGEPDPETLSTLASLGIRDGARVSHMVSGWHHGRHRALSSTRSRELLPALVPLLLQIGSASWRGRVREYVLISG